MILDSTPTSECKKDLRWFVGLSALCLQWNCLYCKSCCSMNSHNITQFAKKTPIDQNQWKCFWGQGLGDVALNLRRWVPHRKASFGNLVPSRLSFSLHFCLLLSRLVGELVQLAFIHSNVVKQKLRITFKRGRPCGTQEHRWIEKTAFGAAERVVERMTERGLNAVTKLTWQDQWCSCISFRV